MKTLIDRMNAMYPQSLPYTHRLIVPHFPILTLGVHLPIALGYQGGVEMSSRDDGAAHHNRSHEDAMRFEFIVHG